MRIGFGLVKTVVSKARAVRQKISVTLTVAFLDLKLTVYRKLNALRQRVKRSVKAPKERPSSPTPKPQKSEKWKPGVKSRSRSARSAEKPSKGQPLPGDVDV